jgi:hypothetical protein
MRLPPFTFLDVTPRPHLSEPVIKQPFSEMAKPKLPGENVYAFW